MRYARVLFCRYLREMISIAGAPNILFASDGPAFNLYGMRNQWWAGLFRDLPDKAPAGLTFTREEMDLILYQNAQRILGPVGEG